MRDLKNIQDNMDLYIKGKLQGTDLDAMNQLVKADPMVANEVELQKIISKAIQDNRKAALKSRLSNIAMPPVTQTGILHHSISKFASIKVASIVVASIGVGILGYLFIYNNQRDESHVKASQTFEKQLHEISAESLAIENPIEEHISEASEITTKQVTSNTAEASTQQKDIASITEEKIVAHVKHKAKADGEKQLEQKFEDPSDADVKTDANLPTEIIKSEEVTKTSDVDIKNISDGRHNFHYMFKESVLYLYGNFDASPYEILEFKEKDGQSIYLYYDKSFFALKPGILEISKLKRISDEKLINNLTEARNNKH